MNLQELHRRIERWEDLHTEFKQQLPRPVDLARAMIAFANVEQFFEQSRGQTWHSLGLGFERAHAGPCSAGHRQTPHAQARGE